ncbi:ATP-binding protein [Ilyobacter polytropus]|uniref:histidine kinase n=1 Tax=Ilyobacter polytropus (strain ATCC 51220 / DSM 2926 / LMG 16218 / CuHBu1) TaxID=572544 RepID=E3H8U8_ILYPC|nr:ATP-binding protein [Ilyobacter polytropus]ADO83362.1 multi-sensor hybrid histidine kinase [Ilyobacter polytropus DSM 2926]
MKKNSLKTFSFAIIFFIILIVGNISYRGFLNYQNTIMTQQIEHLLTSSKSIGKSLELYVDEKEKSLKDMTINLGRYLEKTDKEFINDEILKTLEVFYHTQGKEVSELFYVSLDKKNTLSYPKIDSLVNYEILYNELDYIRKNKKSYVGTPYLDSSDGFSFNMAEPVVVKGNIIGVIFGRIKLENMHELLVRPVKAGKHGYAVVTDIDGNILMHPVKSHIGGHVVKFREKKYPDLDLEELKGLLIKRKTEEEGSYIYNSYWWPQENLERVRKINVFSRVQIGTEFWVVSIIISYDDIKEPIENYLYSSIIIASVIILIFSWVVFLTMRMIKNKEAYELETNYLREINKSTEELRKKDAELHHRRKLETIGTMTGGIAHEFNNVLTPIMGYSELILRTLDPNIKSYDYAKNIYESSERAQEIIDQIRLFSGDKNIKIKYKVISINKVLRDALRFSESLFPTDIKIIKDIKKEEWYLYANETQIHQVVLNLCTNACNAMRGRDDGVIKISTDRVKYQEDEVLQRTELIKRDYVKISFEDNGCGMDEDTVEKIFDPFFTKKLSEKSSGLGLSIVQGIVIKHGGTINVFSEIGKGSRFDVYLPISTNKISDPDKNVENEDILGNESILIIDDDKYVAEMLKSGLCDLGYQTAVITEGSEILKRFDYIKNNFKVVITDLAMPEINGIQLSKKVKMSKPEVKVILMTAYSDEPLEEYMQEGVIDDYLMKPVSASKLSRSIRGVMDNI